MTSTRELNNSKFSNFSWGDVKKAWYDAGDSIKSEANKLGNAIEGKKDESVPVIPPPQDTTILGMHPMTLVIGTVGIMALTGLVIIIFKKKK